jgi:hypothetical protein
MYLDRYDGFYFVNLTKYFEDMLELSMPDCEDLMYYANPHECTFAHYFRAQIHNGQLYNADDNFCGDNLIVAKEDMQLAAEIFDNVRDRVVERKQEERLYAYNPTFCDEEDLFCVAKWGEEAIFTGSYENCREYLNGLKKTSRYYIYHYDSYLNHNWL